MEGEAEVSLGKPCAPAVAGGGCEAAEAAAGCEAAEAAESGDSPFASSGRPCRPQMKSLVCACITMRNKSALMSASFAASSSKAARAVEQIFTSEQRA